MRRNMGMREKSREMIMIFRCIAMGNFGPESAPARTGDPCVTSLSPSACRRVGVMRTVKRRYPTAISERGDAGKRQVERPFRMKDRRKPGDHGHRRRKCLGWVHIWTDDEYVRCQSGGISPSGRVGKRLSSLSLLFWTRRNKREDDFPHLHCGESTATDHSASAQSRPLQLSTSHTLRASS